MVTTANGAFDVVMTAEPPYDVAEGASLGRASFSKTFHGDLSATSTVQMLGARSDTKGSAGYVAIERVIGSLHGKTGSFVLQHSGTMTRGEGTLTVTVVPDSGSGELRSIAGKMTIDIKDGKHFYAFEYTLAEA